MLGEIAKSVKMSDYEVDGRTDWTAYRRAQTANGEKCHKCGAYVMFPKGYSTECGSCRLLGTDTCEVSSSSFIRCPKCRHTFFDENHEYNYTVQEGEHDADCPECEYTFEVSTRVLYTYHSPALLDEDESDEED